MPLTVIFIYMSIDKKLISFNAKHPLSIRQVNIGTLLTQMRRSYYYIYRSIFDDVIHILLFIIIMIKIQLHKFEDIFKQLCEKKQRCLMLFTSESDQKGNYWCPDCQKIAPLYSEFQAEATKAGLPFYTFIAGDRPTWKNPDHKFRKNPLLKVNSVPTMGLFDGKRLTRALVQDQIMKKEQRVLIYENSNL